MRIYLEIRKESRDEYLGKGLPNEQVIIDVTGKTDDEIISLKQSILQLLNWDNYKCYKHICYHDEEEVKPCEIMEI